MAEDHEYHLKFMKRAVEVTLEGLKINGGPFGCVIVKDGKIVGEGHNMAVINSDSTAHGEISAIRDACKNLKAWHLEGCDLYTTCQPCPMCFGAIHWARIKRVFYGVSDEDAAKIGFDDFGYDEVKKDITDPTKKIPFQQIGREDALKIYAAFENNPDRVVDAPNYNKK